MAETIKQTEAIPAEYPSINPRWVIEFHPDEDNAPDPDQLWQRIESYCAYRWTPRQVVWIVEGDGDWCPNLAPLEITAEEIWDGTGWIPASVFASPYGGYRLTGQGPYRFTGIVGADNPPPAAVIEAYTRLHEYSRGIVDSFKGDVQMQSGGETGVITNWSARALQLSGAADLLRNYRRV